MPWCGLFVANSLRAAGIDLGAMKVGVRAKAWADWGSNIGPLVVAPGAILVFDRDGGGHREDRTHYQVLGGNEGDRVSTMRLEKARCIARGWPKGVPVTGRPVKVTAAGVPVSSNEA